MSRRAQENVMAGMILLIFAGAIVLCQDFGPRARMIPLPLAIFGIVLTVIQIAWQNLRSTEELQMDLITVRDPASTAEGTVPQPKARGERESSWRGELRALGVVALLVALVFTVGIIPAVFLFTGGYFVLTRQYSWLTALVFTTVLKHAIYMLLV